MGKFKFILFLSLITYHLSLAPVFAQDGGIGKSQINPASPLYFLKSVREIFELKLAGNSGVVLYYRFEFATRRLREVNSLLKTPDEGLIEPTLERYWSEWGEIKKLANIRDEDMAAEISREAVGQMTALLNAYEQASAPAAKRSIRTAVYKLSELEQQLVGQLNTLNKYSHAQSITISKLAGCNLLSKEASSAALNEVEKGLLAQRGQKCLK